MCHILVIDLAESVLKCISIYVLLSIDIIEGLINLAFNPVVAYENY